jgi:hypothetical protein
MFFYVRECIQKFLDWPPAARTGNRTAVCHLVQLYRYFVRRYSEFCRHNPLYCFLATVYCCKHIFRYRLSPDTFGYTLLYEWEWTKQQQFYNQTMTVISRIYISVILNFPVPWDRGGFALWYELNWSVYGAMCLHKGTGLQLLAFLLSE